MKYIIEWEERQNRKSYFIDILDNGMLLFFSADGAKTFKTEEEANQFIKENLGTTGRYKAVPVG